MMVAWHALHPPMRRRDLPLRGRSSGAAAAKDPRSTNRRLSGERGFPASEVLLITLLASSPTRAQDPPRSNARHARPAASPQACLPREAIAALSLGQLAVLGH